MNNNKIPWIACVDEIKNVYTQRIMRFSVQTLPKPNSPIRALRKNRLKKKKKNFIDQVMIGPSLKFDVNSPVSVCVCVCGEERTSPSNSEFTDCFEISSEKIREFLPTFCTISQLSLKRLGMKIRVAKENDLDFHSNLVVFRNYYENSDVYQYKTTRCNSSVSIIQNEGTKEITNDNEE